MPLKVTFHSVTPLSLTEVTALSITRKFGQAKAKGFGMTHLGSFLLRSRFPVPNVVAIR